MIMSESAVINKLAEMRKDIINQARIIRSKTDKTSIDIEILQNANLRSIALLDAIYAIKENERLKQELSFYQEKAGYCAMRPNY